MQSGLKTRKITSWWASQAASAAVRGRNVASQSRSRRVSFKAIATIAVSVLACVGIAGGLAWRYHYSSALQARAQAGEAEARYLVGQRCLIQATSAEESLRGVEWMRKAAEQGHAKAQTALGMLYARGMGVPRSPELAVHWLTKAAELGEPLAQNELATMYAKGSGVPRDLQKAIYWYGRAASSGSPEAKRNLLLASANQTGTIGDIATAGGKHYSKVSLREIGPDGITVEFQLDKGGVGIARLKVEQLPENLRPLCSQSTGRNRDASGFQWSELELTAGQM